MKKIFLVIVLILVMSHPVYSAQIEVMVPNYEISNGSTISVPVTVVSKGDPLNAIQGNVSVPDGLEVVDIEFPSSIISAWIEIPKRGENVSFAGIIPGGFEGVISPLSRELQSGYLFSIIIKVKESGKFEIVPEATAYTHAEDPEKIDLVSIRGSVISSSQGKLVNIASTSDTNPPVPFAILVGDDDELYDGKTFITFGTTDSESGVYFYTVQEGDREPVPSDSLYVLRDERTRSDIIVRAYDRAGNIREAVLDFEDKPFMGRFINLFAILAIIALVFVCYNLIKGRKFADAK